MHRLALLPLLLLLAACAAERASQAAVEGHEGAHGPPWAANEQPWTAPPPVLVVDPYPWWGAPAVGGGLLLRGPVYRHHRGVARGPAVSGGRRGRR